MAAPLALITENSRLRSELIAEKALCSQLQEFRRYFETAVEERGAKVKSLEDELTQAVEAYAADAANHATEKKDLTSRLLTASHMVEELQKTLDARNLESSIGASDAVLLRNELSTLRAAHVRNSPR